MKRLFRTRDFQPDAQRDVDEELQSHLELKVEDLMARGMGEEEAWVQAHKSMGAPEGSRPGAAAGSTAWRTNRSRAATHTRNRLRRRSLLDRFDTQARDLRYALRRMARSPVFTLVAILSLAIGIGANTAVFSVVNGLFLRPPPYRNPHEVVQIWIGTPDRPPANNVSWEEFERLREVEGFFTGMEGFDTRLVRLRDGEGTRSAYLEAVTPNLFPMLGIEPALGRFFLPDEGSDPGGNPLAILGHGYWTRVYDKDPGILGGTVYIAGHPFTIVGVAPPELSALQSETLRADLYVPLSMASLVSGRTNSDGTPRSWPRSVNILARLAPGIPLEAAEERVWALAREIRQARGLESPEGWGFRLWPIEHAAIGPAIDAGLTRIAAFLLVVAGLVLLLACTNLTNLFLARGVQRRREMAVRLAIGAGRRRLVTQLLTEALLLSGLGGVAGFFLAQWTLGLILRLQPNVGVTFTLNTSPDIRVLLFSFAVVGLAAILFGLTPALAATKEGISPTLAAGMEARRGRVLGLRGGLVALQMAVSVILLTGAGLFFHSLVRAQGTDPGFRAENGVAVWVDMERSGLPREAWARTMEAIRARAAAQPGVQELGVADLLPLGSRNTAEFHIPGVEPPEGRESHWANVFRIDEGYLGTMGIPLLSGRGIQALDGEGAQSVVVVSQAAARRFWPEESPLGKDVTVASTDQTFQVVGVVGDVKVERLGDSPEPTFYFSLAQNPSAETYLVARGTGPNVELISSLRRAVAEVDPDLLVMLSQTLEERVGVNLYPARMAALFLGGAGALALLLAAIGLYGVVSLSVSRRTREVGIRMSLGADARRVVGTVLRGSLTSVALGAIIGLALAIVGARLIRSFLFGVDPADPATLVAVPLLLGTVAAVAALIPALRASRVDPVEALKEE